MTVTLLGLYGDADAATLAEDLAAADALGYGEGVAAFACPDGPLCGLAFMDPGPLVKTFPCTPNADTPVDFDVTVMRQANQGFFDVAVSFDAIFCAAKLDCCDVAGDPGGDPDACDRPAEDIELSLADGGDATVHVEGQHRRLDVVLELADGTQERLMEVRQEASPKRTLVVPVRHEGGALIVVDVDSGQHARVEEVRPGDDVTLRLARGRPTRVRLPHVPWPFRPWSVDAESRDGMRRVRGVIDDAARFVTFQGLPPGRWTIEARVGVDRTYVFRAIDVEPGQQDVLLALVESDLAAK